MESTQSSFLLVQKCIFTNKIPYGKILRIPVAHGEGRFLFDKSKEKDYLAKLEGNDQLVFTYCDKTGKRAKGRFPINPNGSFNDIAGICSSEGNVFGMMPHPERAYYRWHLPNWTKSGKPFEYGDGRLIFQSMIEYIKNRF